MSHCIHSFTENLASNVPEYVPRMSRRVTRDVSAHAVGARTLAQCFAFRNASIWLDD